jgi:excisionase family DNA binding protein
MTSDAEEYMTVRQAREYLGISKVKIASLIKDGVLHTLPSSFHKSVKLIPRSEVEALARSPRPKPEPVAA